MQSKPRLFTYTIPIDDGAAPNPFRGMCSLAICKPAIRRVAKHDDWVAGLGSKNSPSGNLSGRLVYAMRVHETIPLEQYDKRANTSWPHRVPNIDSADLSERLGDCIYDYSKASPSLRPSVHGPANRNTDLGGRNALISYDFYYWGQRAIELPAHLRDILHQTQGHRSDSNDAFFHRFVTWLRSLKLPPGMHGWPDYDFDWQKSSACSGCIERQLDGETDRPF